jgi:hypothetical protein
MSRSWLCAVAAVLALSSCGKGDNPLVAASDGQFKQWIEPKNAFSASCAAALYDPALFVTQYNGLKFSASGKISSVSEQQKTGCVSELQQRASQIGIAGNVTREQLLDDRVRQRYAAARKG